MENPFRSEEAAYRFLMVAIGAIALIVAAKVVIGTWAALVVFVLELVALAVYYVRQRGERPEPAASVHRGGEDEKRILVVANETVGGTALLDEIARRSEGYRTELLVVCPALNSRLRTWTSDEDGARAAAAERLDRSLARLRELGVAAEGSVGEGDPVQCIDDALRTFGADEVVIATHPEGRSKWLAGRVVEQAQERFAVPIAHVVVDLEAERGVAEPTPASGASSDAG